MSASQIHVTSRSHLAEEVPSDKKLKHLLERALQQEEELPPLVPGNKAEYSTPGKDVKLLPKKLPEVASVVRLESPVFSFFFYLQVPLLLGEPNKLVSLHWGSPY